MRIRWRGLELPSRVIRDESVSTDRYGRFIAEPFEQGFGTTVGNSLRRILLSSLEDAAITTVKISGVAHEFMAIDGVLEDVTDIILNIKGIVVTMDSDETKTMVLECSKAGEVHAGDIKPEAGVEIVNGDHYIATLTEDIELKVEFTVKRGRGYATAAENRSADQEIGVIPVDSVYSPVVRVRYKTEDMRVGQKTNYDRLILEVWTRGSMLPEDALVEAGTILRKHLNPFVMYHEMGMEIDAPEIQSAITETHTPSAMDELLQRPVATLNLSVRANNCLEQARITTVGELVSRTDADLLRVRSFGRTSLHEVKRKLAEIGLSLGMKPGETPSEPSGLIGAGSLPPIGTAGVLPTIPSSYGDSQERSIGGSEESKQDGDENSSDNGGSGHMEAYTG